MINEKTGSVFYGCDNVSSFFFRYSRTSPAATHITAIDYTAFVDIISAVYYNGSHQGFIIITRIDTIDAQRQSMLASIGISSDIKT